MSDLENSIIPLGAGLGLDGTKVLSIFLEAFLSMSATEA